MTIVSEHTLAPSLLLMRPNLLNVCSEPSACDRDVRLNCPPFTASARVPHPPTLALLRPYLCAVSRSFLLPPPDSWTNIRPRGSAHQRELLDDKAEALAPYSLSLFLPFQRDCHHGEPPRKLGERGISVAWSRVFACSDD